MDFESFTVALAYAVRAFGPKELPGEREVDVGLRQAAEEACAQGLKIDDVPNLPDEGECPLCARYWDEGIAEISKGKVKFTLGVRGGGQRVAQIAFQHTIRNENERAIFQRMAPRFFDLAVSASMWKNNGHEKVVGDDLDLFTRLREGE